MERDEFDSCREVIDFLVEKLNSIPIDNIPVFASRGNVEDWDEPFLLINSPDVRIDEGVKRCYITIDIRCDDGSDYEAVVDKIEDIVQVLDSDPNLTSFSSDSGQLFISYILSKIDPDECKHESISSDYQVWPPPIWECDDCGETICCECWKSFVEKSPYKNVSNFTFKSKVCWKCKGEEPPEGGGYAYADKFRKRYWQEVLYEYKDLVLAGEDEEVWKKAENKVRRRHDVPEIGKKYVSETDLYRTIDELLSDYKVVHHARPEWLQGQEIDIFVPSLMVGIEYMGRQHYESVAYFGGEEALEEQKKRDKRKRKLCKENGVELFYVKYDDNVDEKARNIAEQIKENNNQDS